MGNLIINALAFEKGFSTSTQIQNINKLQEIYFKNCFVSLVSCKLQNPSSDVCLITNVDIPDNFSILFRKNDILVYKINFESFKLSTTYQWGLAFFKLCALEFAVKNLQYKNYLLLDTDTYCVNNLKDLWDECDNGIVLFDVDHKISHPHRAEIYNNLKKLDLNISKKIVHYGGEFIAGNKNQLAYFIEDLKGIFKKMSTIENLDNTLGDEFILSIAGEINNEKIIRGNKYIYRYWTGKFYLVSTNYQYNAVDIWHLPAEKEYGMLILYNYYIKNSKFPSKEKCASIMNFPKSRITVVSSVRRALKKVQFKVFNI